MVKIGCILLLKNENKFVFGENDSFPSCTMLVQQMEFLKSFVDAVYVMDDHSIDSSDDIYGIYKSQNLIKSVVKSEGMFDENRYYNTLIDMARNDGCDWLLYLDGDEIMEDAARKWILEFCNDNRLNSKNIRSDMIVRFFIVNLWRSRFKHRTDKWNTGYTGKLFKVNPYLKSFGTPFNNHFIAYNIGNNTYDFGQIINTKLKILHYAWVDWNHMLNKRDRFIKLECSSNGKTFTEANKDFNDAISEDGIILETIDESWCEEYRTGEIKFEKLT